MQLLKVGPHAPSGHPVRQILGKIRTEILRNVTQQRWATTETLQMAQQRMVYPLGVRTVLGLPQGDKFGHSNLCANAFPLFLFHNNEFFD
jgi:hypothetical protein